MRRPRITFAITAALVAVLIYLGLTRPLGFVPFMAALMIGSLGVGIGVGQRLTRTYGRQKAPDAQRRVAAAEPDAHPDPTQRTDGAEADDASQPPALCPLCGSRLIRRTAVKAPDAGRRYLACRNWSNTGCGFTWGLDDGQELDSEDVA